MKKYIENHCQIKHLSSNFLSYSFFDVRNPSKAGSKHKEETLDHDFSKKCRQNILNFGYVVENYLNFHKIAVSIAGTFFALIES